VDVAKKVGLTLFVASWLFPVLTLFVLARAGQAQQVPNSDFLFAFLLLLSGIVFASRYMVRRAGLGRRGKLIMALVILSILLLFFAPAVQTLPRDSSTGSVCKGSICSTVTEWASITTYYYCWGASYSYDRINGLVAGLQMGCPPPL
jgi:hypothetical protein